MLCFLSLLFLSSLNPFGSLGDQHQQPWELLDPNPQGSGYEEGLSLRGDTDGVPGCPWAWGCLSRLSLPPASPPPVAALPLLSPPRLSPPAQPRCSSSSPQQLQGVLEKRAAPPTKFQAQSSQGKAGCWQGGILSQAGPRSQESPRHRENMPGVSGKPTSTLRSARRPLSPGVCRWSCQRSVSYDTALPPWAPKAIPGQHPSGMATKPRATPVSPRMLVLTTLTSFLFPFLPWGSKALCSPCAPAKPGGSSPRSPRHAWTPGSWVGAGGQQHPGLLACSSPAAPRRAG